MGEPSNWSAGGNSKSTILKILDVENPVNSPFLQYYMVDNFINELPVIRLKYFIEILKY